MHVPTERAELVLRLFDEYYERVYAFLRKSTSPEVAEDLAQEVFVRLLQHPHLERLTLSVSYLLKIAHNLMRRRFSRASRLKSLLEERSRELGSTASSEAQSRPGREDRRPAMMVDATQLEAALDSLNSEEQTAVRLIVCEGKSYQHAAESLGVSVTTVNNWKHRGLVKMRRFLAEEQLAAEPIQKLRAESRRPAAHSRLRRVDHWVGAGDGAA